MNADRLKQQLDFITEIDKLKHVLRRTLTINDDRNENDAEHSWHLAIVAVLLAEHVTGDPVDVSRVVKMVLLHDIVEVDAGDTYCYSGADPAEKLERETRAADRLFNVLPAHQGQYPGPLGICRRPRRRSRAQGHPGRISGDLKIHALFRIPPGAIIRYQATG